MTISIGVACQPPNLEHDRAQLLGAADKAVYAAKRAGRNRVVPAWEVAAYLGADWRDSGVVPE